MYFGNIISEKNISLDGFKNLSKIEDIDNDLPTIIIGWGKVKELYGDTVSILHKKINTKVFWTFSEKERKVDFEVDIENFKEYCYNNFGENIPYVYLDILYGKKNINKKIIKKILSLNDSTIYITENEMVYIYSENILFGIDLNIFNYYNNKKEKVLNKIKSLKNSVLVDSKIFNKYRDFLYKIKDKKRLIPYIIKNGNAI
jgi:hypothetical protein